MRTFHTSGQKTKSNEIGNSIYLLQRTFLAFGFGVSYFPPFYRHLLDIVTGTGKKRKTWLFDRVTRKASSFEKGPNSSRIRTLESQVSVRESPCQWQVAPCHFPFDCLFLTPDFPGHWTAPHSLIALLPGSLSHLNPTLGSPKRSPTLCIVTCFLPPLIP